MGVFSRNFAVSLACLAVLVACGGPYAQKGRYASESQDRRLLSDEAYQDLAEVRAGSDYDAITDYAVECVSQTSLGEQLLAEMDALHEDAHGARESLRARAQQAATRCLIACPRVQAAKQARARDAQLGKKYGPRCDQAFAQGALQLREGERALARARAAAERAQWLEVRDALQSVRSVVRALTGESSKRREQLSREAQALSVQHREPLARVDVFLADPWVKETRGRLHAISLLLGQIAGDGSKETMRVKLLAEQQELSHALYQRRQEDGI